MDFQFARGAWCSLHWSLRYQIIVLLGDWITKFAVIQLLDPDVGHFAFLTSGWGFGVGWLEHPRPEFPPWFPLGIAVVWSFWIFASVRKFGAYVENSLNRGIALGVAGAFANSIDVVIDQSGTDFILLVSPWWNQAINVADIAICYGIVSVVLGFLSGRQLWRQ